jgi:hypothetical protein
MLTTTEIITYLNNLKDRKQSEMNECMRLRHYDCARRVRNDIILLEEILNEIQ